FYLVAALALVALSVYALAGAPSARGLLLRTLAAGLVLALCALCRPSALLLGPGFALALALGVRRAARPRPGRALLAVALSAALVGPFLLVRQPEQHGVWSALWEGLGDFDREKGHAWSDPVAEEVSRREGGGPLWTPGSEAVFRRLVLTAVRSDPGWYAAILLKRVAATATQWKLWPRRSRHGTVVRRATSPNEGFMDKYYGYTTTADHVALGRWRAELPMGLVLLPALLLSAAAAWRRPAAETRRRARAGLRVMGAVAAGTLVVPVLISTAAAQEAQAFALVFVLALAFAVDAVAAGRRSAVAADFPEAQDVSDGASVETLGKHGALQHPPVPQADA
ncbi:MAG TPA: hypothetical protein VFO85_15930, partial [Vicinamibacteria bacterium]|nr:hypothetical protein [Vicinamibacteria bacterium]